MIPRKLTRRARAAFLAFLAETGNVSEAARAAGIGRRTAYHWKKTDEVFAEAWDDAEQALVDRLEQVARERAIDGSERMLVVLLKALRPEKYADRGAGRFGPGDPA